MSNYPGAIDTDVELPIVSNNLVDIGEEAINAIRDAVLAIEEELGVEPKGSTASVRARLDVALNPDGTIRASALTGLGLVTLPITNSEISATAGIVESKLSLTHSTQDLFDLISDLDNAIDVINGFINLTGIKVEPHIAGSAYRHKLSHIDIDVPFLKKVDHSSGNLINRDNTNLNTLLNDINTDYNDHVRSNGLASGEAPPTYFGHVAGGIFLDTSNFATVPQSADSVQEFAEFVDQSSLSLLGSRTQNLYSNGIPRSSRTISYLNDTASEPLVSATPATTYLLFSGATSPVDDITHGDDVILLNPTSPVLASNVFDEQFAQVKPGDFITVSYGNNTSAVTFTIDSTKSFINGSSRTYIVRINGKNLYASSTATVSIARPYYHDNNKYGVLATAAVNNTFNATPSLVLSNPRSAVALGLGFNPSKFDSNHYNLYLTLYPTGNPTEKTLFLPAIDVTGNSGATPGKYTLNSVIEATNNAFHRFGFNFRFSAFEYQGEFGIMLNDAYRNASFSIISGTVDGYGNYTSASNASFINNVVDNFNELDPLGLGVVGSNLASPPYAISHSSPLAALVATVIFYPLKKNFFYVNGVEKDVLATDISMSQDTFGDGYWLASIDSKQAFSDRVEVTYKVDLDLSTSNLKSGKTIVVQPAVAISSSSYSSVDYGRFIISNVVFDNCCGPNSSTLITVYDGIHGTGVSPYVSSSAIPVHLYFSNDSVSFDDEHVSDANSATTFKRHFEVLINDEGKSFTHERGRFNISGSNLTIDTPNSFILYSTSEVANFNLYKISPKLKGYSFGVYRKINLLINSYNATTGIFDGYLSRYDGSSYTRVGPTITGKKGEITRFYDETNIDFIDVLLDNDTSLSSFSNKSIDIQLFPSLSLNEEKIFIASCQLNDTTNQIKYLIDERQFGNTSEKQLSLSAIDFINAGQRLLHSNGVIRGFDFVSNTPANEIAIKGGSAVVNGKIVSVNDAFVEIPILQETLSPGFTTNLDSITWFLCVNDKSELELVASTDYDTSLSGTYGSLDHNRLFYVRNPNLVASEYIIRASYLSDIMNNKRDLVPLYVINATVVSGGGSYSVSTTTVSDIRKFMINGYGDLDNPFVFAEDGSIRSFDAVNAIFTQLLSLRSSQDNENTIGATVKVKGNNTISSAITLDFDAKVIFEGDGGTFTVPIATGFNLKNNIEFRNIKFNYTYDATLDGSFNDGYLINPTKACILSTTGVSDTSYKNVSINNCTFASEESKRFPFISFLITNTNHFVENVNITNNIFETTASGDDKDAVIAISSTMTSSAGTISAKNGPRITNSNISGNICNKNQLIAITAPLGTSNLVRDALSTVNTKISNNICGAICYLTKQDQFLTAANTTLIKDKDNLLVIDGNTCKFIYCGLNTGFINNSSNRLAALLDTGMFSGSAIITNNACSWIQVGIRESSSSSAHKPLLVIEDNELNAFLSTYLSDYYNGISVVNTAVVVDRVSGA